MHVRIIMVHPVYNRRVKRFVMHTIVLLKGDRGIIQAILPVTPPGCETRELEMVLGEGAGC